MTCQFVAYFDEAGDEGFGKLRSCSHLPLVERSKAAGGGKIANLYINITKLNAQFAHPFLFRPPPSTPPHKGE
ncbi:hypothetical protein MNBD_ALPHA08-1549 [hydrothermal vent metagenome]|uniref:Uncharacterized protein n=1 Tax=hydrothermal vent metagenome TaxID=652676 RepID=A0A3B0S8P9_9ZZZZ